jgi:hypothetical protein
MRVVVFGAGLVGRRTAEFLVGDHPDARIDLISHRREPRPLVGVRSGRGWSQVDLDEVDVIVLATEDHYQFRFAQEALRSGRTVVTTADDPVTVERLWALGPEATRNDCSIVVGAAYSPGISTLLASSLVAEFDEVTSIATAQFGTGGPACARAHHRATSGAAMEVRDGLLRKSRGGTGRELVWFPDPVGAADCYRAGLAEPFLLHQQFPEVGRIESRQAATRRDRLTARLPMLRPPHPEGLVGSVWVEVRGRRDGRVEHRCMAATAAQATGAAAMATAFCELVAGNSAASQSEVGQIGSGRDEVPEDGGGEGSATEARASGSLSAAGCAYSSQLLQSVAKKVRLWTYDGSHVVVPSDQGALQAARKWKNRA